MDTATITHASVAPPSTTEADCPGSNFQTINANTSRPPAPISAPPHPRPPQACLALCRLTLGVVSFPPHASPAALRSPEKWREMPKRVLPPAVRTSSQSFLLSRLLSRQTENESHIRTISFAAEPKSPHELSSCAHRSHNIHNPKAVAHQIVIDAREHTSADGLYFSMITHTQ